MHPLLYHAYTEVKVCVLSVSYTEAIADLSTRISQLRYIYHYDHQWLSSPLALYIVPYLSPINAKLTSVSYVHASKSLIYLFLCQRSPLLE